MDWNRIEGSWKELKGKVREKWAKLTDDDFESIGGKKDRLIGKIQSAYGYGKDQAEREINDFHASLHSDNSKTDRSQKDLLN